MTVADPQEQTVGDHTVTFEDPDIYIIRQIGDITGEQMTELYDLVAKFSDRIAGPVYGIIDLSRMGVTAQDARRTVVSRVAKAHRGIAFVGVPLVARVGISLGYKAYIMMTRAGGLPHVFVDTQEDARAWIQQQRK